MWCCHALSLTVWRAAVEDTRVMQPDIALLKHHPLRGVDSLIRQEPRAGHHLVKSPCRCVQPKSLALS